MALFGAPLVYEGHARRAVIAALEVQRRRREHAADRVLPPDLELAVRMGLHTGLVVVGRIGDNLRMDYTAERSL
jgi:class 3 adenylate cyclase